MIDSETNLKAGLDRLEPSSSTSNNQSAEDKKPSIEGKGIIKTINASTHTLTLQHEPIPALNWPEMTMDFPIAKQVDFNFFKVGDHIQFSLEKDKENRFVIIDIKKLSH